MNFNFYKNFFKISFPIFYILFIYLDSNSLFTIAIYLLCNNFFYDKSIANAPIGAVKTIASTATVSTVSPQENPSARGIPPIAA